MKLNQLIALVAGKKKRVKESVSQVASLLERDQLFDGLNRVYRAFDEEGENLPPESTRIQYDVNKVVDDALNEVGDLMNLTLCQDLSNESAKGDIKLNDEVVFSGVPIVTLLSLEKTFEEIRRLIDKVPTLPTADNWKYNDTTGVYEADPEEKNRTKKIPKTLVLAEATKEHPAQVQVFSEDVPVGVWTAKRSSSRWPITKKRKVLSKIDEVIDAIKLAREEANSIDTQKQQDIASVLFKYTTD